ncbi:MAG: 50S ribosomal protein L6 [Halanaerobiaceae bacterium]
MSRIGKVPVEIPEKVEVEIGEGWVKVEGPKGSLEKNIDPRCNINIQDDEIKIERPTDSKADRALQGMTRSIIDSMVTGVTEGFEKKLQMKGVGYNAQLQGKKLVLEVGFSHPVEIEPEQEIEFEVENLSGEFSSGITVKGIDKQKVGEVAAKIREIRKPEPYKGKGIRYEGEQIRRKVGKTG